MSVKLSPVLNEQQFSDAGILLSGGKIETYLAGSSTPAATYTTSVGNVAQANPIILNTRGEVDNLIYLTTGIQYKLILKDAGNNVLRTYDNIQGVNDLVGTVDQWVDSGVSPTFVNTTQFTLSGDQTNAFHVNRRVKLLTTAGTVYGYISASAFTTLTTVTVALDSGVLDSGLSSVQLGLITPINSSVRIVTNMLGDGSVTTPKLADGALSADVAGRAKMADGYLTNAKLAFDGGAFGFRNKIIGGDFTTNPWQRGTSFAAILNTAYSADRWTNVNTSAAVFSILKTADAPTASQAGLFTQHCIHVDITTADAAIAAGDVVAIRQYVEGFNVAPFGFGQAGSRFTTLSFWVKGAKTGVHCVSFVNSASDRSYVAEYTINAANSWEYKVITIPVDNAGTWLYDNGVGLRINFTLAVGTTFQTAAGSWTAGNFLGTANQVNNLDNVANDFKIALVQLEAGQTATPFEQRGYGQELMLCQRYFEQGESGGGDAILFSGNVSSASGYTASKSFKTAKRDTPTISLTNGSNTSFPATTGTPSAGIKGFAESRTANASGPGAFSSTWTSSAEL